MFTTERKQDIQRVIKGITITPDNEAVSVIEATLLQKTCDCMQRYMNGIVAAEARNHLQCQKAEYIIGGVAMTSEGPVYIVSTALKKIKTKFIIDSNLSEQPEQEGVCLEKQLEFACNKGRQEIKEKNDNEKCQEEGYSKHTCQLKNQERCTSTNSIQESCTWKNDTGEI